ncbi:MAG: hypothetical protein KJ955_03690 [Nanoarchaeota archaeon]|nr:hypothetical protein [Nanoarchaeota archaeon]
MRSISDKNILDEFCIKFCSVVEKHCKYIVVSGFVAISSGRTRATEDIDMIIERIPIEEFKKLHSDLLKNGFSCIQSESADEIFDYLMHNTAVRYIMKDRALPQMEMKFAKDALDDYQLKTRIKLPLTGLGIWFSSINMNIAFKEEALKSDKDLKDAEHLRKVYSEMVDEQEISEIKKMIRKLRL